MRAPMSFISPSSLWMASWTISSRGREERARAFRDPISERTLSLTAVSSRACRARALGERLRDRLGGWRRFRISL